MTREDLSEKQGKAKTVRTKNGRK